MKLVYYISEMNFLCETLKKNHINVKTVLTTDRVTKVFEENFATFFNEFDLAALVFESFFGKVEGETIYKRADSYGLNYIYMLLPETEDTTVLFIGPFTEVALNSQQIMEIAEKSGISPSKHKAMCELYSNIPIIDENNPLLTMVTVFCEKMWRKKDYEVSDVKSDSLFPVSPININSSDETDTNDILLNMETMEKRYEYENEMMLAVSSGQTNKMEYFISKFNYNLLKKRTNDTLRNVKNYCIIMNTLLRKAAQDGGVHPFYIDSVSSQFALRIEQLQKTDACTILMAEMFKTYCRLVRQHSMKNYSPIVQRTIAIIDSDISANLNLSTIAKQQNLSSGYLSAVFKQETGSTLTEYIHKKRVKHAEYLLSTTHLQIQTVALHCGIVDVHYFSKLFKKQTGKTPKEYREELRFK